MAWVSENSNSAIDSYTCSIIVPAGGYTAGHLLVMGVGTSLSQPLTVSATDTRGNTWIADQYALEQDPGLAGKGTCHQLHCRIMTNLEQGDEITVSVATTPAPPARLVCVVEYFDDSVTHADVGSGNSSQSVQNRDISSGVTSTTSSADQLVVGVVALINSGRTFTAGTGFTAGEKIVSTAGTGNRAAVMQWKYVTGQGPQESYGTVDANAYWAATVQTYALGEVGSERSGLAKVWTGDAWEQKPAKVWNGTDWQPHEMRAWDGADWRKAK